MAFRSQVDRLEAAPLRELAIAEDVIVYVSERRS
jgi:hypothetical protein